MNPYDFASLCTPHYQALVHYAGRLIPGRPQDALDLVQEAFLRAVRRWPSWSPSTGEDPSRAARGWLHRIVQNVFLDLVRAGGGRRTLLDSNHDTVLLETYGTEEDHVVQVLSDGVGDEVRRALDSLDPDHRAVVERVDFAGEPYLVVAAALEVPIGTVMSRLHRGRKRLGVALKHYASAEYGISKKEIVVKTARRRSHSTREAASAREPAETPEPDTDGIDGIMAGDDYGDFLGG